MTKFPRKRLEKLRAIKQKALEWYCNRVLDRIQTTINSPQQNAHQKYLDVWRIIRKDGELLSVLFDTWSRNNASIMFMGWVNHGLMTEGEFDLFSDETKEIVSFLDEFSFYQPK